MIENKHTSKNTFTIMHYWFTFFFNFVINYLFFLINRV